MYRFTALVLIAGLFLFSAAKAEEMVGISNKVKWVTASEVNNFGFDVIVKMDLL